MTKALAIMLAGGLGALARYGLTLLVGSWQNGRGEKTWVVGVLGVSFPLGTLLINVLGTLLLAILATLLWMRALDRDLYLILATGFLGAFTTWSTFSVEAEVMLSRGDWKSACLYVFGNLLLSFAAVWAGRALALRFLAAS